MTILVTAPYKEHEREIVKTTFGKVVYRPWKPNGRAYNEEELIDLLKESKADALITEHDHVTKKVVDAFKELEFIGVCRGTPSNVDVAAASEYSIPVFYTPARNAQAVAEMFVANVITLMRNTLPAIDWLERESWKAGAHDSYLQFKGNELAGKTIGLVGFGAIGQLIAKLLIDFPCSIIFYDPYVKEHYPQYKKVTLENVFSESDIVSIHLPANNETENMINRRLLTSMKKNAVFVNTSRAMVVNRQDLLQVLEDEKIRGAVLDVFDAEPPDALDYKLIHLPQVLATPHIAGATHEVEDHHAAIMNKNLLNWFVKDKKEDSFVTNRDALVKVI